MAALSRLPEDGVLLLRSGFEPKPLYGVLEQRGFTYDPEQNAEDVWEVAIRRA
jgi:uncharacterized protein (DUF2249 family)